MTAEDAGVNDASLLNLIKMAGSASFDDIEEYIARLEEEDGN